MLISEPSRQALATLVEQCARTVIPRSDQDSCEIVPGAAGKVLSGDCLMAITTTSFAFRLMTIFHVADNEANRAYFVPAGSALTLQEGFAETANLCCGALNRELSAVFRHLAMSIPYALRAQCIEHLPRLKSEYTAGLTVNINGAVKVAVTLSMNCSAPVEIPAQLSTAQQTSGELELF